MKSGYNQTGKGLLLKEMENFFGNDAKRINHARRVLGYAEEILAQEGGDQQIIEAAAVLHDIGIHAAEQKHGSTAGKFQESEGPPIAENILKKINFPAEKIPEVLAIIAHHHTPGKIATKNFQILYEADWLVNIKDEVDVTDKDKAAQVVAKVFQTKTGQNIARKLYL